MLMDFLQSRASMTPLDVVFMILAYAVILLLCLPVHEFAHGIVAYWCGDKTAKWHGRLSLNPFRHLDLWGTIMILTVGMGYAKPVPVVPRNFRNYKRDMILVALAGPLSNFLMAVVGMFLFCLVASVSLLGTWQVLLMSLCSIIIDVNISLMVFNLLPIPPLDGSRLWSSLLPGKWAYTLEQYSRYITMGLFLLLFTGVLDMPLYYLRSGVFNLLFSMFSWMIP